MSCRNDHVSRQALLGNALRSCVCMQAGLPAGLRRWAVRTALACICLMAARFVPFLAYVMSLIGSFLTISVSVIFPAACHLSIFQARARTWAISASYPCELQ